MGGTIQGPQIQASRPQMMAPQMMQGAPRQPSFFEKLLGATSGIVGMFNPVAGAAMGAAHSLMSGDAGGFAQNLQQAASSSQEAPADKAKSAGKSAADSVQQPTQTQNPQTAVDTKQAQAPLQQPQMPLWMYQDPMLLLMMRYGMMPGMGENPAGTGSNTVVPFGMPRLPHFQLPPGYGNQGGF